MILPDEDLISFVMDDRKKFMIKPWGVTLYHHRQAWGEEEDGYIRKYDLYARYHLVTFGK